MLNKKRKIIILGCIVLILLSALVFVLIFKKDSLVNNENEKLVNKKNLTIEDDYNEDIDEILQELKNIHPEFTSSQLEFYLEAAINNTNYSNLCKRRSDHSDCVSSVAFIKGDSSVCGEIGDQKMIIECADPTVQRIAAKRNEKCQFSEGSDFTNCLKNIFLVYRNPDDCSNLKPENIQQACKDIIYYETAFIGQNRELCKNIIDEKLNQICNNNITDKSQNADNDGLSDYEETSIYKTDPNKTDTDGDGYSDGDEVKNGYNPLGEGKL
ncbi:MAG: hypothetical protein P1P85_01195 [Patescibacteria group bacterium]|nr:hypothetical protein [Patescibacteria group bacterium]